MVTVKEFRRSGRVSKAVRKSSSGCKSGSWVLVRHSGEAAEYSSRAVRQGSSSCRRGSWVLVGHSAEAAE